MEEFFPVAAGVVAGLLVQQFVPIRLKTVALVVLSLTFGFLASYVSGELLLSYAYVLVDVAKVIVAAAVAAWLMTWIEHRSPRAAL